jgi:hypothetical protein
MTAEMHANSIGVASPYLESSLKFAHFGASLKRKRSWLFSSAAPLAHWARRSQAEMPVAPLGRRRTVFSGFHFIPRGLPC